MENANAGGDRREWFEPEAVGDICIISYLVCFCYGGRICFVLFLITFTAFIV